MSGSVSGSPSSCHWSPGSSHIIAYSVSTITIISFQNIILCQKKGFFPNNWSTSPSFCYLSILFATCPNLTPPTVWLPGPLPNKLEFPVSPWTVQRESSEKAIAGSDACASCRTALQTAALRPQHLGVVKHTGRKLFSLSTGKFTYEFTISHSTLIHKLCEFKVTMPSPKLTLSQVKVSSIVSKSRLYIDIRPMSLLEGVPFLGIYINFTSGTVSPESYQQLLQIWWTFHP